MALAALCVLLISDAAFATSYDIETSYVKPLTPETFQQFVSNSRVRLVYFSYQETAQKVKGFLQELQEAAQHLGNFGISIGQVNCDGFETFDYCHRERTDRVLYGFRGGRERLVLPLSTLVDETAIIASALHLALIHMVPILQSQAERRELENKCKGHCDIVFAYHNALGTVEHRIFLELAWRFLEHQVFTMTTAKSAEPHQSGYNAGHDDGESDTEHNVDLWLLQCSHLESMSESCIYSGYRGPFLLPNTSLFIKALQLPTWIESKDKKVWKAFQEGNLHEVFLIYDKSCKHRILHVAPALGRAFRGKIGVIVLSEEELPTSPLANETILPPSIAFRAHGKKEFDVINEFYDAFDFVLDELKFAEVNQITEEVSTLAVDGGLSDIAELRQDDEVAQAASGDYEEPETCPRELQKSPLVQSLTIYYLDWDPPSKILLRILHSLRKNLTELDLQVYEVSCFHSAEECNIALIKNYPTLEFSNAISTRRLGPQAAEELIKTAILFVSPSPVTVTSEDVAKEMLKEEKYHTLGHLVLAALGPDDQEDLITELAHRKQNKSLFLLGKENAATYISDLMGCKIPCLAVLKFNDPHESKVVHKGQTDNVTGLEEFVTYASQEIFAELTPSVLQDVKTTEQQMLILLGDRPATENNASTSNPSAITLQIAQEKLFPQLKFTWIPRDASWLHNVVKVHAPNEDLPVLIVFNLQMGCSYRFPGITWSKENVVLWLKGVFSGEFSPTAELPNVEWHPLHPGFDYLRLLEEDRERDAEDFFLEPEDQIFVPDPMPSMDSGQLFHSKEPHSMMHAEL